MILLLLLTLIKILLTERKGVSFQKISKTFIYIYFSLPRIIKWNNKNSDFYFLMINFLITSLTNWFALELLFLLILLEIIFYFSLFYFEIFKSALSFKKDI